MVRSSAVLDLSVPVQHSRNATRPSHSMYSMELRLHSACAILTETLCALKCWTNRTEVIGSSHMQLLLAYKYPTRSAFLQLGPGNHKVKISNHTLESQVTGIVNIINFRDTPTPYKSPLTSKRRQKLVSVKNKNRVLLEDGSQKAEHLY